MDHIQGLKPPESSPAESPDCHFKPAVQRLVFLRITLLFVFNTLLKSYYSALDNSI